MDLRTQIFVTQPLTKETSTPAGNAIFQRKCARDSAGDRAVSLSVPRAVHETLMSSGQPLNASSRQLMESRFGCDFSRVRVHADAKAAESAESVNALAYTVGRDVVFGAGQYAPGTQTGRRLLAHELAHVVQQGNGPVNDFASLRLNSLEDRFELEADRVANHLMSAPAEGAPRIEPGGHPARLSLAQPGLQRAAKFVKSKPDPAFNLAERAADGHLDAGNTDFVLNGRILTDQASAEAALHIAKMESTDVKGGNECQFDPKSEPTNEVSYKMKILKSGNRWSHVTTKGSVAKLFPGAKIAGFKACVDGGDGFSTLTINGTKGLAERVQAHEEHHAADYRKIFDEVLLPWDKKVTEAIKGDKKMKGKDVDTCQRNFYRFHIGEKQMPNNIASSIINSINTMAVNFHGTPAGRKVNISLQEVKDGCNNAKAEAT